MDGSYLTNPLVFLVQVLFGVYALALMLRFLLQLTRADFHNPVSQFLVKVTTPVLHPVRRVVPGYRGVDTASLILVWVVKSLELLLIILLTGIGAPPLIAFLWSLPQVVELAVNVFLFAILIQVVLSWINPAGYNPVAALIESLTAPLIMPLRRRLPPMGGLDFSPMVAMIGLVVLKMLLLPPLQALVGTPFR